MASTSDDGNPQVELDNAFFKRMLDLVPATFYFDNVAKEKLLSKTKGKQAPDPDDVNLGKGTKRNNGELSNRAKAKRAKFDPEQMRTVTRVQEILNEEDEQSNKVSKKKNKKGTEEVLRSSVETMDDLQKKLQTKIVQMKAKRVGLKRVDAVEAKRMKRRESKMKLKLKKNAEKKNAVATKKDGSHKVNGDARPKNTSPPPPGKTIFNKEGKIVFSKFDFSEKKGKKLEGSGSSTNFKKLLEKVEKGKKDLKKLKADGDFETAHSIENKASWHKALLQTEGVKVKDDPELLKKTIKRKEKIKNKSSRDWDERKDKVDKRMKERQDKRTKNIKSKKQSNKDSKIKKSKKKGRVLPGF